MGWPYPQAMPGELCGSTDPCRFHAAQWHRSQLGGGVLLCSWCFAKSTLECERVSRTQPVSHGALGCGWLLLPLRGLHITHLQGGGADFPCTCNTMQCPAPSLLHHTHPKTYSVAREHIEFCSPSPGKTSRTCVVWCQKDHPK